jgi:hypothetical protein
MIELSKIFENKDKRIYAHATHSGELWIALNGHIYKKRLVG